MTIDSFLLQAEKTFQRAGIATARLDALVILSDCIERNKAWLLANGKMELNKRQLNKLETQVAVRATHEPLAYIRGKSEFYGREFAVTPDTLQPRPETETMIELLLKMASEKWQVKNIIDVGTGSGCIAITAKLELPETNVIATDISQKCLEVAQKNAKKRKANVQFCEGNLLDSVPSTNYHLPTTILANLPYVPDAHTINQAAMHEPKLAIFGGKDGLEYYRELFAQIKEYNLPVTHVFTESLPPQHDALASLASDYNFKCTTTQDFIQVFEKS